MGVMKISFGNMTVELKIFNFNTQPLDYDEICHVCLIEEIIDDIDCEDPEIECFTQDHDDLDFDRLIGQENDLYEPSLEDPDMEYFAPSGGCFDFSEPLQHDEPMYELIRRTWSWNVSLSMEETWIFVGYLSKQGL
jgi:hypothetical protein